MDKVTIPVNITARLGHDGVITYEAEYMGHDVGGFLSDEDNTAIITEAKKTLDEIGQRKIPTNWSMLWMTEIPEDKHIEFIASGGQAVGHTEEGEPESGSQ
jgi:hypothetical protein